MKNKLLEEGDVIILPLNVNVYAEVPKYFLYSNCKGEFKEWSRGEIEISGELSYFASTYIVVNTVSDGGGTGMGPNDIYPDGHHVYCEMKGNKEVKEYKRNLA